MGRTEGPVDYQRQLKAFEMYSAGIKKSDIALELGVTKAAVGNWAKKQGWDEKLTGIVARAEAALNNSLGNEVAETLKRLRVKLADRINELEFLCSRHSPPATRLAAIKAWMELAGIKRGIPDPTTPTTPKSIELIEDLLNPDAQGSEDIGPHSNDADHTGE